MQGYKQFFQKFLPMNMHGETAVCSSLCLLVRKTKVFIFVYIFQGNNTIEMIEKKGRREGGRKGGMEESKEGGREREEK